MKLVKSLLLGTASGLLVVAGASAADLPSRKAAPVSYVKVCDAYGAGFFYIPGTETCVKVGGRVRADYAFSAPQSIYTAAGLTAGSAPTAGISKKAVNAWGVEARGRVDLDARTQTAWGTVQTVVSLRLGRTSGILKDVGPLLSDAGAAATLEAAYIRFAGFTFGAAKDNFSFMPSTFYGRSRRWRQRHDRCSRHERHVVRWLDHHGPRRSCICLQQHAAAQRRARH
jgi:hypothetical protein